MGIGPKLMRNDSCDQRCSRFFAGLYDDFHPRSSESELFSVLLAGNEDGVSIQLGLEQGLLVGGTGEWQGDLSPLSRAALHGKHDLRSQRSVFEAARVNLLVIKPIGHVLDIGRHV